MPDLIAITSSSTRNSRPGSSFAASRLSRQIRLARFLRCASYAGKDTLLAIPTSPLLYEFGSRGVLLLARTPRLFPLAQRLGNGRSRHAGADLLVAQDPVGVHDLH